MVKNYNKLVRDKIPEIIKDNGEEPIIRILQKREFIVALKKKVLEEAKELISAKGRNDIVNEIIDMQELIDTLLVEMGIGKLTFWSLQIEKSMEKGRFKKRIFLIKTKK